MIKIIVFAFFTSLCLACDMNNANRHENTINKKAYVVTYSLLRRINNNSIVVKESKIASGSLLSSPEYSQNDNERTKYLRENNKCVIATKTKAFSIVLLDTTKAQTYLFAEPALDWYLFTEFYRNHSTSEIINTSHKLSKYYIGEETKQLDSIYVYSKHNSSFPDSIIYIGKHINKQLVPERNFISDILIIHSVDSVDSYNQFKIDDFLNSDSIRNRKKIHLDALQKRL